MKAEGDKGMGTSWEVGGSSDSNQSLPLEAERQPMDLDTQEDATIKVGTEDEKPGQDGRNGHSTNAYRKRRSSPDNLPFSPVAIKKIKSGEEHTLDQSSGKDKSLLPAAMWHRIFTFCLPQSLGKLALVNKLFNVYLDPASSFTVSIPRPLSKGILFPLQPNLIWKESRILLARHMVPSPLRARSELDMWRLVCSPGCQFCGKKQEGKTVEHPKQAGSSAPGPGQHGVALVWPFAVRTCGQCLQKATLKEIDLYLSDSTPCALMPALSHVFLTEDLHAITPRMIQNGAYDKHQTLQKVFLASEIEALKKEFYDARALGLGALEEWLKGLEDRGKEKRNDRGKWEDFAAHGGLSIMRSSVLPARVSLAPVSQATIPGPHLTTATLSGAGRITDRSEPAGVGAALVQSLGTLAYALPAKSSRHREFNQTRAALTKVSPRLEVERRAALVAAPMPNQALRHIPLFQAALQVAKPLTDQARPPAESQLLAQRAENERRSEVAAQVIPKKEDRQTQSPLEAAFPKVKKAQEASEDEWEKAQRPLKARIAGFADEFIRERWEGGRRVTTKSCTQYAVETLNYIREKFYAAVQKDANDLYAAGKAVPVDPPQGPFTYKLTLENMRWVFEVKIKEHTDAFTSNNKEIFFCNGCAAPSIRSYTLEGVIQHYAAKHTKALSAGNVVVHWRAEWPSIPPYSVEKSLPVALPLVPKPPAHIPMPPSYATNVAPPTPAVPSYSLCGAPDPAAQAGSHPRYYQPQPFPGPPNTAHNARCQGQQPAPYGTPYQPCASQLQYLPHVPPSGRSYGPQAVQAAGAAGMERGPGYLAPMPMPPGPAPQPFSHYNCPSQQQVAVPSGSLPQSGGERYRAQLDEVAKISREIWLALSNTKDLPGSARIFVTLHHAAKRFRGVFSESLPLALFYDGLSNHKEMRPVRNISSLACKACKFGLGNAAVVHEERTLFSFPQLVHHFLTKHVEPMQRMVPPVQPLNWARDMIVPPGSQTMAQVLMGLSHESQKYRLLREAFPDVAKIGPESAATQVQCWQGWGETHQAYQYPTTQHPARPPTQPWPPVLPQSQSQTGSRPSLQSAYETCTEGKPLLEPRKVMIKVEAPEKGTHGEGFALRKLDSVAHSHLKGAGLQQETTELEEGEVSEQAEEEPTEVQPRKADKPQAHGYRNGGREAAPLKLNSDARRRLRRAEQRRNLQSGQRNKSVQLEEGEIVAEHDAQPAQVARQQATVGNSWGPKPDLPRMTAKAKRKKLREEQRQRKGAAEVERRIGEGIKREEDEFRAVWPADRAEVARAHATSARPGNAPYAPKPLRHEDSKRATPYVKPRGRPAEESAGPRHLFREARDEDIGLREAVPTFGRPFSAAVPASACQMPRSFAALERPSFQNQLACQQKGFDPEPTFRPSENSRVSGRPLPHMRQDRIPARDWEHGGVGRRVQSLRAPPPDAVASFQQDDTRRGRETTHLSSRPDPDRHERPALGERLISNLGEPADNPYDRRPPCPHEQRLHTPAVTQRGEDRLYDRTQRPAYPQEDMHSPSHSHSQRVVETYEVVKVIDSQGEYLIRRPVRHTYEHEPEYRFPEYGAVCYVRTPRRPPLMPENAGYHEERPRREEDDPQYPGLALNRERGWDEMQ